MMRAIDVTTREEVADKVVAADKFIDRMKGLLGRTAMVPGEGLWIKRCRGVHSFGMKFNIDVVFLDKRNTVVAIVKDLHPNRVTPIFLRSASVLEIPARENRNIRPGHILEIF